MVTIANGQSAEAWLKEKTRQVQIAFGARCAARALPGINPVHPGTSLGEIVLPVMRAVLTSGVAAARPKAKLESAALACSGPAHDSAAAAADGSAASAAGHAADACYSEENYAAYAASKAFGHSIFAARPVGAEAIMTAASIDASALDSTDIGVDGIFGLRLWPHDIGDARWRRFVEPLAALFETDRRSWGFWQRWYEGMLNGKPLPWELHEQVALIPDEDWDKGPKWIAEKIREIEIDFRGKPLDQEALKTHLQSIISNSDLNADAATSAANLIEEAVQRFKDEAPANGLPDGFKVFGLLPDTFRRVATVFTSNAADADKAAKLQEEVNHLHDQIIQLRFELSEARQKISELRLNEREVAQMRSFGERLQTRLLNITMMGSLGLNVAWFCDVSPEQLNYRGLMGAMQALTEEMREVEPFIEQDGPHNGPKFEKPE